MASTTRSNSEQYNGKVTPVMLEFLQFLEKQMTERPDLIEPVDRNQLARIGKLIEGVNIDDTDDLTH